MRTVEVAVELAPDLATADVFKGWELWETGCGLPAFALFVEDDFAAPVPAIVEAAIVEAGPLEAALLEAGVTDVDFLPAGAVPSEAHDRGFKGTQKIRARAQTPPSLALPDLP